MTGPIVNIADLAMKAISHGARFEAQAGRVGAAIGLKKTGAQYFVVPPGKTAFPFHNHHANEELYLILEGEGSFRLGEASHAVKEGDFLAALAGGADTAHQLINTGQEPLRYIVFSTRLDPDITEYPDSGKISVASQIPDGGGMASAKFGFLGKRDQQLGYYDGED